LILNEDEAFWVLGIQDWQMDIKISNNQFTISNIE